MSKNKREREGGRGREERERESGIPTRLLNIVILCCSCFCQNQTNRYIITTLTFHQTNTLNRKIINQLSTIERGFENMEY